MTIQDVFNKYKGQSLLVPGADPSDAGQCVQAADYFIHEAYGLPYVWLNAIDFWQNPDSNLKANFDFIPYSPNMPIKQGDFVIYGSGVGSPYGHISTAGQDGIGSNYLGYDSNWAHNLTLHAQPHNDSYNQYILGILRLKSNNGGVMKPTRESIINIYQIATGNNPSEEQITAQLSQATDLNVIQSIGQEAADVRTNLQNQVTSVTTIADQRFQNEKAVADLVGVSNPDDTASIVNAVKALQTTATLNKDNVIAYIQEHLQ